MKSNMSLTQELGFSLDGYQDFGIKSRRTTINKQWLIKIEEEYGKKPIGICMRQINATEIIGQLLFDEEEISVGCTKPLVPYGNKHASLSFKLPNFFTEFIGVLPNNDRNNKSRKHPKVYCKVRISSDFRTITWYVDDKMMVDTYHYMQAFTDPYEKKILKKIDVALKILNNIANTDEVDDRQLHRANEIINDLRNRGQVLERLENL